MILGSTGFIHWNTCSVLNFFINNNNNALMSLELLEDFITLFMGGSDQSKIRKEK